jgi:UDP-N-acetylglucosamine:LPS N-acetylglucosamine transferase
MNLYKLGKPSILIPYPNSKNNHQEKNAMILSSIGGSILIDQDKISKVFFEETLKRIFKLKLKGDQPKYEILDLMKKNMENLNSLNSTNEIQKLINYFLKEF